MKKIISFFILITIFIAAAKVPRELPIGRAAPMPDKKLKDIQGTQVSFNDVKKSNGLLVIFSCNTCPWVIRNQQVAAEAMKYASSKNMGVIIINSNESQRDDADSPEEMKKYAANQKYQWPYVIDENNSMADAFGAKVTPECYLFNKDLKLIYHGAITDNPKSPSESAREHLKIAIDETISSKAVSMTTSKAMGCGIKRRS